MSKSKREFLLERHSWNVSRSRSIDDATLNDLLGIIHYEADRLMVLETVGLDDYGSTCEVLFDYVLDALGVPENGHRKFLEGETPQFSRECVFAREGFYEIMFGGFCAEYDGIENPPTAALLARIRSEIEKNLIHHYR